MNKTIFEEYAILDAQIKVLEEQKENLKPKIFADMAERGEIKTETGLGKFTITQLKKWTYPAKVVKLGEDFKAAKAEAESTGEATFVEEPSLRFTGTKI